MKSFSALLLVVLATCASDVLSECNKKSQFMIKTDDFVLSNKTVEFVSTIQNKKLIKIQYGNIYELCVDFVKHFQGAEHLVFAASHINYIEPGAFHQLQGLKTLEVKYNYLIDVGTEIFNKLKIEHLNLKANGISYIAPNAFNDMGKLKTLNLDYNRLTSMDPTWFQKARSISVLSMKHNFLTSLPARAFEYFSLAKKCNGDHDMAKNDCPIFDLSYNRLDSVEWDSFEGINKIKSLYLDNNDLVSMPDFMAEIRQVSLQYNDIVEVRQDILADYVASYTINTTYIHGNPLSKRSVIYLDTANDAYKNSFVYQTRLPQYEMKVFDEGQEEIVDVY